MIVASSSWLHFGEEEKSFRGRASSRNDLSSTMEIFEGIVKREKKSGSSNRGCFGLRFLVPGWLSGFRRISLARFVQWNGWNGQFPFTEYTLISRFNFFKD